MGAGCSGIIFFTHIPKLLDKRAPQYGWFLIHFMVFTSTICVWCCLEPVYVRIFGNYQYICLFFTYVWYSQHKMSATPFTIAAIFYSAQIWSKISTFMLVLLCQYFRWYICWFRKNRQHKILDNTDYKITSVENYYQEMLQKFMITFY